MSDYSSFFGHTRRSQRQQRQQHRQQPSDMMEEEEEEQSWQAGRPTQQSQWDESSWQAGTRGAGTRGSFQESMQAGGYPQAYPRTTGTQRYGGPTTRAQGAHAQSLEEGEQETEDMSKIYSEESSTGLGASQHEGDYLQGSQRSRQQRSQRLGEGQEQSKGLFEDVKDATKRFTGRS
ncbi:hypothetical protein VTO42DRAFT_3399 [Malbranchea cinnamomea]